MRNNLSLNIYHITWNRHELSEENELMIILNNEVESTLRLSYVRELTFYNHLQVVVQFFERIVARFVFGNDMFPIPRTASILEKIVAWINGGVDGFKDLSS